MVACSLANGNVREARLPRGSRRKARSFDLYVQDMMLRVTAPEELYEEARVAAMSFSEKLQAYGIRDREFRTSRRPGGRGLLLHVGRGGSDRGPGHGPPPGGVHRCPGLPPATARRVRGGGPPRGADRPGGQPRAGRLIPGWPPSVGANCPISRRN